MELKCRQGRLVGYGLRCPPCFSTFRRFVWLSLGAVCRDAATVCSVTVLCLWANGCGLWGDDPFAVCAAHEYPEVLGEMLEAWKLLPAGGFLVGDDFHASWPGVQRAVWELITRHLAATEVSAASDYACAWHHPLRQQLAVLRSNEAAGGPVLLHGRQWMVRKQPGGVRAGRKQRGHDRFDVSRSLTTPIATLCDRVRAKNGR